MKTRRFLKNNGLYLVLGIVTVIMLFVVDAFYINEYLAHPQFAHYLHLQDCFDKIEEKNKTGLFHTFFIIDFIWAFLLLVSGYKLIHYMNREKKRYIPIWYLCVAIPAYLFDILENVSYLLQSNRVVFTLETNVNLKVIFYGLTCIVLFYHLYKSILSTIISQVFFFLKTSVFSLLIILVIVILITFIDQGGTIIVALFSNPLQLLLTLVLLKFLVVIVSHYPIYMQIWGKVKGTFHPGGIRLKMYKKAKVILGFGIIYFIPGKNNNYDPEVVRFLRRSLGVCLYMAMFHVFLFIANRYFEWNFSSILRITLLVTIVWLVFYYKREHLRNRFVDILFDYGRSQTTRHWAAGHITKLVKWAPITLLLSIFSSVLLIAWLYKHPGWNEINVLATLLVLLLNTLNYTNFRLSRAFLRYVFYSDKLNQSNPKLIDPAIRTLFAPFSPSYRFFTKWIFKAGQKIAFLSDNRKYLNFMRVGGLFSLALLLFINLFPLLGHVFNPLNVILLYIIFYYSISIILLKHILYYSKTRITSEEPFRFFRSYRNLFKYFFPIVMIVAVFWVRYSTSKGNDLHLLQSIPEAKELVNKGEFLKAYRSHSSEELPYSFLVASYGGGLKANLWNLLVFHELTQKPHFLPNTLCFSGVSGGAVGIGNYFQIYYNKKHTEARLEAITKIGRSNLLSTEIAYLLGGDFIRELVPGDSLFYGKDRSYFSMQQHASLAGYENNYQRSTYREWWSRKFREEKYVPALIINTTSTKGKQGIALSLFNEKDHEVVPAADNILNLENDTQSISYYNAVSASNRFPILSPAAKIFGKGYYLDGGYFENSGLLSAMEFYEYLFKEAGTDYTKKIPVFINVINSEEYYILEKIKAWGVELDPQNGLDAGELKSILKTLVSTEKLPRYVTGKAKYKGRVVKIMMPHKIQYEKVKALLGGAPRNPLELMDRIEAHNDSIDHFLHGYRDYELGKWGVVTPPLSRLLGKEATEYQKAMIQKHPEVRKQLLKIEEYLKPVKPLD